MLITIIFKPSRIKYPTLFYPMWNSLVSGLFLIAVGCTPFSKLNVAVRFDTNENTFILHTLENVWSPLSRGLHFTWNEKHLVLVHQATFLHQKMFTALWRGEMVGEAEHRISFLLFFSKCCFILCILYMVLRL